MSTASSTGARSARVERATKVSSVLVELDLELAGHGTGAAEPAADL